MSGITSGEFAAYYIVWTLVRNMNVVFTPFGWEERIREGQFSGLLLRPIHPIHWDLGYFAGWKVVVIILWLPIAYVLSLLFHPTAHITPLGVIVFFISIWGAYLIRSLNQSTLGMVTFWTTRVGPLFSLYFAAELLLSGRLVPPQLLPDWAQQLASILPFQYTFAFPIEALIGDLPPEVLLGGLVMQGLWIVIGAIARAAVVRDRDQALLGGGWLMRALQLFWTYARIGALNELQYRANLVIQLVESAITLVTGLSCCRWCSTRSADLNGWSHAELLAVMGVYTLVGGIIGTFIQPNMERLIGDVRQGTLDYVLTKPGDSQVLVSVREIRIWRVVDVVLGIVILAIAGRGGPGHARA